MMIVGVMKRMMGVLKRMMMVGVMKKMMIVGVMIVLVLNLRIRKGLKMQMVLFCLLLLKLFVTKMEWMLYYVKMLQCL